MPDIALNQIENESERLACLHKYDILDTPPDGAFANITEIIAMACDAPIAIVSLVDHDRIWFKSKFGVKLDEIERSPGLCSSAIMSENIYEVKDAMADPHALTNPLVAGEFGLRFYAASPLKTSGGYNLGTLCIIDKEPRSLTDNHACFLEKMAAVVMDQIELRLAARKFFETQLKLDRKEEEVKILGEMITICAWSKKVKINDAWVSIEEFLSNQYGLEISYGMSKDVAIKLKREAGIEEMNASG